MIHTFDLLRSSLLLEHAGSTGRHRRQVRHQRIVLLQIV